ncbi:MAG: ABC transporter substrate-binding protein [Halobacteriales archaeon]
MSGDRSSGRTGTDRRTFLKVVGASGVTGLTGCIQGTDETPSPTETDVPAGDQGDGGMETSTTVGTPTQAPIGTVTWGVINPMTGPYSGLAPSQRNGNKLAIQYVNESDEFEFEIDPVYEDTGTDPATGRRKAQKVVEQDGAQYIFGAISSSVALGLNEFAKQNQVIYTPGAAAVPITGANCNAYVFRFETNTAQIAEACAKWTVNNLGNKVWFHIADYAYGNSVLAEWRSRMQEVGNFEEVGVSRSKLGAGNFGSYISQIANSDAEVAVLGMTGGDLINFFKQAANQGLKEQVKLMAATGSFAVIRGAAGKAAAGTWNGVRYVPKIQTGDNPAFVQAYQSAYDGQPDNFARVGYDSIRMVARGIQEAGTADPTKVKDVLAGLEMQTIFGQNRFRECDHQAMNPVWVGKNAMTGAGSVPGVQLINKVEGQNAIPPCDEVKCSL